jgi:hypothetical protein
MRGLVALAIVTNACVFDGGSQTSQVAACLDYVQCAAKLGASADSSRYGMSGSCWATLSITEQCDRDCRAFNHAFVVSGAAADAGCTFTQ